jgi:cytochrome c nitrite reductase small subunit
LKRRNIWAIVGVVGVVIIIAGVALWNYHEQPQFCATCHVMKPYLESWQGSDSRDLLAHDHAQEGVLCLDCHEPTLEQQVQEVVLYVKGEFSNPLKGRKYPLDTCLNCHLPHEHTSYQEIIERTQDYLVDGNEINPHGTHLGQEECYRCHRMHKESLGITYCYSCHHERTLANDCSSSGCHGQ